MPDEYDLLLWGLYLFYALLIVAVLAFFAGIWWLFAGLPIREALRARAADNWWLPFLPRADGSWGPLVSNMKRKATKADQPGDRKGLIARWGIWCWSAVCVTAAIGGILAEMVKLAVQRI